MLATPSLSQEIVTYEVIFEGGVDNGHYFIRHQSGRDFMFANATMVQKVGTITREPIPVQFVIRNGPCTRSTAQLDVDLCEVEGDDSGPSDKNPLVKLDDEGEEEEIILAVEGGWEIVLRRIQAD